MIKATQAQYNAIVNQLKVKDSVKIICVNNVDDDGDVQNDFVIGRTYIAKRLVRGRFDIHRENETHSIWDNFDGESYDRFTFFKLATSNVADERLLKAKKVALEKKSTDDLIKLIKMAQIDLELSKEIVRARVEGVI